MVFKFRMLSDENDSFVRDYEVMYDMTLLEFNNFICRDLGYDATNMSSFFLSDKEWNRLREFTLMDMGDNAWTDDEATPIAMSETTLGRIIHRNHDRLIYLFDMLGDRAYYLELTAASEAVSGVRYPRTVLSEGEPSDQFNPEGGQGQSIFDQMMGDFNEFEGDENYDDEY